MKRNKKLWNRKRKCKGCGKFKTWGGIKKWFGLQKIQQWSHNCKCEMDEIRKAENFPFGSNETINKMTEKCDDAKDYSEGEVCQKNGKH